MFKSKVKVEFRGRKIVFYYVNCQIKIPAKTTAAFVCSGCGSGKTLSILDLVEKKHQEGILIAVNTTAEANRLAEKIRKLIGSDKVALIHSQTTPAFPTDINTYTSNPNFITEKEVVIVTHLRLSSDPICLLLYFGGSAGIDFGDFGSKQRAFLKFLKGNSVRQWILVDETPTFIQPMAVIKKIHEGVFTASRGKKHCWQLSKIKTLYDEYCKSSEFSFFRIANKLNNFRVGCILNKVKRYCREILKFPYEIKNTLKDLAVKGAKCKIFVFDGTADTQILEKGDFDVILPDSDRYNSYVEFCKFTLTVKRKVSCTVKSTYVIKLVNELEKQLVKGEMTLFVVWKDYKVQYHQEVDEPAVQVDSALIEEVKDELRKRGYKSRGDAGVLPGREDFDCIYWGSGKERSCNDWALYSTISLVGNWTPDRKVYKQFEENFGCKSDYQHWRLCQLVQAICRTRIRLHKGDPIKVYYSDDIDTEVMNMVIGYFNKNSSAGTNLPDVGKLDGVKKRWKDDVEQIGKFYPDFINAVSKNRAQTFSIPFSQLDKTIFVGKMAKEHRVRAYKRLQEYLKKEHRVTLNIT